MQEVSQMEAKGRLDREDRVGRVMPARRFRLRG